MLTEYPDLKLDLADALARLEDQLTLEEVWEVHVQIELGDYEGALLQLRDLASAKGASDVGELLEGIARRGGQHLKR